MQLLTVNSEACSSANAVRKKLIVGLASTQEEIRALQRLRYNVFIETFPFSTLANADGIHVDEFDECCDHLIVQDTETSCVVGTYRMMSPAAALRVGGYYSEREFDLGRLNPLRAQLVEAGHACVHPDYRSGGVLALLWSGIAAYMQRERGGYLIGCASVSLSDGGDNAQALYRAFTAEHFAPSDYQVTPHTPFPIQAHGAGHAPNMPPLLKGYLRSGAWVCGMPALDAEFNVADFFMLLPLSRLGRRYSRHYFKPAGRNES
ncbi:GNAT family N-acetyltransferase [Pseudomonas sp. MPB23]|uniref:GNAT family N-acetyltransferase n=1 Tax=Pseudomonas sp. MPB23 TaxID=3388490 RepID=UPI0039851875